MKVVIVITNERGLPAHVIRKSLKKKQFPSVIALNELNNFAAKNSEYKFSQMEYIKCDPNYVFQCYSNMEPKNPKTGKGYFNLVPQAKLSSLLPLQKSICLDDIIKISHIDKGANIVSLINGNGFYDTTAEITHGSFNYPEAINFVGINVYQQNISRGNHYHYRKVEYTYVISGEIIAIFRQIGTRKRHTITFKAGDLIRFLPGHHHILTSAKGNAIAIEASPQIFNRNDIYH